MCIMKTGNGNNSSKYNNKDNDEFRSGTSENTFPQEGKESKNHIIKKELPEMKRLSSDKTVVNERRVTRQKYLFDANGRPRKTFCRMTSCDEDGGNNSNKGGSIESLFGGTGTHPWSRPKTIPHYRGDVNPFIQENELFVAGDW